MLFALAHALDVTLADLVEEPAAPQALVVRAADRPPMPGEALDARLMHRSANHDGTLDRSGVVEHVHVLDGQVRVGPSAASVVLDGGDYAHHPADVDHVCQQSRRPGPAPDAPAARREQREEDRMTSHSLSTHPLVASSEHWRPGPAPDAPL